MYRCKLCLGTLGGLRVEEQIPLMQKAGWEGFFTGWSDGSPVAAWRRVADECGMLYQSIHAPFLRMAAMWHEGEAGDAAADELIRGLDACVEARVPLMIAHVFIGFAPEDPTELGLTRFARVVAAAEARGVRIAFENTEGEAQLAAVMRRFADSPAVGFCWDSGHEMCYNYSRDLLALYGDRLLGTHLNDNLGIRDYGGAITYHDDLHLLPLDGTGDWPDIARRLARCGFDGPLTFELNNKSHVGRHENDACARMSFEEYLAAAYTRACRVATMYLRARDEA